LSKLTTKQEKYVQGLIAGLSQREAYRKAYPNSNKWKDSAVDSNASTLMKNTKVSQRYNELMDEHKEKALWTREDSVKTLIWLVEKSMTSIEEHDEDYVRQGTSGALMSAVQELNKMEGFHSSEKVDLNAKVSTDPIQEMLNELKRGKDE
jgi:hypothetical protein